MPRKLNGAKPPEVHPDHQLAIKLLNEFRNLWVEQMKENEVDPMKYSRLSLVALTQLAAIVGVDVGMSLPQFEAVCKAQFETAYAKAPRFS